MEKYAGLDWGNTGHAVCVVDEKGKIVTQFDAPHSAEGLRMLLSRLARIGRAAELPIAIERPSGLVVDTLVEAGHPVVPIHPNALKACRPRYRAAGGKSDPGAAASLCEGLDVLLTVLKLDLGETLAKTLRSTNAIENLNGRIRDVIRRVKRWRGGSMALRWGATAVLEAEKEFRRVRGYREMPGLLTSLEALCPAAGQEAVAAG